MIFSRSVRQVVQQWRTTVLQGGEIDRCVVGCAILGTLRHGVVEVCHGVQGHSELGDEGLNQEGMRDGRYTLSGGQRCGTLAGLDARVDDVAVAHVMGAEEALQGRAARELGSFQGWPWGEKGAEQQGVFVLKPLQDVREVVFQGTREAMGEAHCVADHTAAMCDALRTGMHRRALGVQGLQCVAMLEQEVKLECGVRRSVFGMAGREGFAVLGQGPRVKGNRTRKSY
jgi:hypothetical protein